ncbi:MAG TPA: Rv1355c family protein [Bacteroidia bacterium]|nr:Rv1355c family protein [Bacteroidia bacterium]
MENKLQQLTKKNKTDETIFTPFFFRLKNTLDKERLNQLLEGEPGIYVFDELVGQVEELVKSQNPKIKFNKDSLTEAAKKHIGNIPHEEYGVWIYYPWSNRLIHILDEQEFVEVRTSRNQYKITPEEKAILATKKIGVMGLSVGQSVSVTMAMERVFGELRLADFDILELSNYNRIRTGLHNLGVPKVISVAREIAEIDPFLKVTCYPGGINEENIDEFFLKGGKLDIVLDECDGLYIKILCRQKAKDLKIPVVMETSDRGMLDVERFDLEPQRAILHGLIDHLDMSKVKEAKTNEEKIPYILPMVGIDKISTRLKASMIEVEQTITTWPQLASAVTLGGGLATDVCRRILLNHFQESGRFYVDVEELINNKKGNILNNAPSKDDRVVYENYHSYPFLTPDELNNTISKLTPVNDSLFLKLNENSIKELVEASIQAPSGGNCQPWKWVYKEDELMLFFEKAYNKSFLDFNDISSYLSLGAAFENLVLKAHEMGLEVKSEILPIQNNEKLLARIWFLKTKSGMADIELHDFDHLAKYISLRCTNRNISERKIISEKVLMALEKAACSIEGVKWQIAKTDAELKTLGDIVGACDRLRFLHPQSHYDLYFNEVRWNKEENERTRDGVDIETIPFTPSELAGFKMAKDSKAIAYLRQWKGGRVFEKASKKAVESASVIAFMTMPKYDRHSYFNAGRAVQRLWLEATMNGIAVHPLMVPIMLFTRITRGNGAELSKDMIQELQILREQFLKVFKSENNCGEIFLLKLFIAEEPKVKSMRRPVEEVLYYTK